MSAKFAFAKNQFLKSLSVRIAWAKGRAYGNLSLFLHKHLAFAISKKDLTKQRY